MNAKRPVTFREIGKGIEFHYDGDLFRKTAHRVAWEIKGGCHIKEWAFMGDEVVEPKSILSKKKRK